MSPSDNSTANSGDAPAAPASFQTTITGDVTTQVTIGQVAGSVHIDTGDKREREQLISILELRKDDIVQKMRSSREMILNDYDRSVGHREFLSEEEHRVFLEELQSLFVELHTKNTTALANGQLMLSHEITAKIHVLLWRHHDDWNWREGREPHGISYCIVMPSNPLDLSRKLYPAYDQEGELNRLYPAYGQADEQLLAATLKTIELELSQRHPLLMARHQRKITEKQQREVEADQREAERRERARDIWGDAVCANCGAKKGTWADNKKGICAICGNPLHDSSTSS